MTTQPWTSRTGGEATTLDDLREEQILAAFAPYLAPAAADVGPGDDAAVLPATAGRSVVTTDSMVLGLDWRDDWSSPVDVGRKIVAQNIADVVAMGARPTGVVVALAVEPATRLDWVLELTAGMSDELRRAGTGVLGGDLSGLPSGVVLTVTALGELAAGDEPFLRSAARPGDVVVVSDRLGRSHAGLLLLRAGDDPGAADVVETSPAAQECLAVHRAPSPRYEAATEARRAGLRCAMDVSDGLVRDAGRIARASGVAIDLDGAAIRSMATPLVDVVGERALDCVLAGGEEHCLLGTCAPDAVPDGWFVLGHVRSGAGVTLDGTSPQAVGWDHFRA